MPGELTPATEQRPTLPVQKVAESAKTDGSFPSESAIELHAAAVNSSLQAYATLPFVSALVLAFAVAQNPPCSACDDLRIVNVVSVVNSFCVACALLSLTISLLVIYQASKLVGLREPLVAMKYLKATCRFRMVGRNATYFALFSFVLSFGICLAGSSTFTVACVTTAILFVGMVFVIGSYVRTTAIFRNLLNKSTPSVPITF
jgi:hypothetical protein